MTFTSLGRIVNNIFTMATWLEPLASIPGYEATNFPETWTIFYWAWWVVYAPFVGLFVARISRGRTIKEMTLGTLIYGTLGCVLFFGILGNYGLYLQLSQSFDVIGFMNEYGASAAIIAILDQLPISWFIIPMFTVLAIIFLATTFDSASYILAAVAQKKTYRRRAAPLASNFLGIYVNDFTHGAHVYRWTGDITNCQYCCRFPGHFYYDLAGMVIYAGFYRRFK